MQGMTKIKLCTILIVLTIVTACKQSGNHALKPNSWGRPFEVVVLNDADSCIYNMLTASIKGLPQGEPQFDVTSIGNKPASTNPINKARSIVIVSIDASKYSHTAISYEKDVYAHPQLIIHVSTPSVATLHADSKRLSAINTLLRRHEINACITQMQTKHNPKMEQAVKQMFGINMRIPSGMNSIKKGNDFIWMSNNSPTAMQNICIYTSENRDSVMQANIKGETDSMYMTTVQSSVNVTHIIEHGKKIIVKHGLWQMHGDDMGGPFVSHTIGNAHPHKTIVIEAFIFAPGLKKRNLLAQTEASLFTIRQE